MTPSPPSRDPALRSAAVASATAFGIAVVVALAGQAIALVVYVARGATGAFGPYARLGAVYVELFHHVDVGARVLPVGGAREASAHLGVGLLGVGALAVVPLGLLGRRLASRTTDAVLVLGVVASSVAYAIVPLVLAFVARGKLALPATVPAARSVDITVSAVEAFVVPAAVAAAAIAVGALVGLGRREGRPAGDAAVADVVAGGVRSFALGVLLSLAGVLVFASAQPSFARAYGSVVTSVGSFQGRLAIGGHLAFLVPNQAVWVLVPAMGAADEALLEVRPAGSVAPSTRRQTPFLSYRVAPSGPPVGRDGIRSPGLGRAPAALLAFLVVPLAATLAGGARAARSGSTARVRAALGAASGLVFAALVAVAIALSRVDVRVAGPFLATSTVQISMGPALASGAAVAAGWGLIGGAAGGALSASGRRRETTLSRSEPRG
jgi:hypothetical protein